MNQDQATNQILVTVLAIQQELSVVKQDIGTLKADVSELKSDVSELKSDVAELKSDVSILKSDMQTVKSDLTILKRESQDTLEIVQFLKDNAISRTEHERTDTKVNTLVDILEDNRAITAKDRKRLYAV